MPKPNLLILDDYEGLISASPAAEDLRQIANLTVLTAPLNDSNLHLLDGQNVLLALRERTKMDAEFLQRCQDVELILQTGGSAYHVDREQASKQGLLVALGKGAKKNRRAVSELAMGMMLSLMRNMPDLDAQMRTGAWFDYIGDTLDGKTLGILGCGRQGQTLAKLAQAFQMNVIGWGRSPDKPVEGITKMSLEDVLAQSDVLSINLRLSDESRGFLTRERIFAMKPGAILINTARGAIVDEAALIEALQTKHLRAAGLDVFAHEPLAADSPLRSLSNVILTPHVGWKSADVIREFTAIVTERFKAYLAGELLAEETLNPEALDVERTRFGSIKTDH